MSVREGEGLTVLLVEDDPDDRWLITEILRSRGCRVVMCEDAETAWDAFRDDPPPLVLLDLVLPSMDGLELCRRIRRTPEGETTVIIVVTGRDEPQVLESVLEAGADDYLAKPVDVTLLDIRLAVAEREVRVQMERRRAREELAAKSREMEILFENLDEVFFSIDVPEGRLIQVSPGARKLLGHSPETLVSDPERWRPLLYPSELEAQQEELERLEPSTSLLHQYRVERPDGSERWVEARIKAALDDRGELVRIDGVLSDVTERRRAREELAVRNQELMTLYRISEITLTSRSMEEAYEPILEEIREATGYPIVLVERVNPSRETLAIVAARGLGLDPEERLEFGLHRSLSGVAVRTGKPVVETDAPSRDEHRVEALRALGVRTYLSFPMIIEKEVVGTLTLAHTRTTEPEGRLVRWAGSLANTLASFVERMSAQEALRESEQRYRRLANELRRANDELESFAYSVSHDLRAPLRTMQGFAHALLQNFGSSLPEEARDYARRIIRSGERSEDLISDLLDYSRLSFTDLELEPVELDAVVDAAREQVQGVLAEADAELRVDEELPVVRGHGATLIQVLVNLLSNAVKFVPDGRRPRVRVRAEETDVAVRLSVEDNGIGVPPDQRQRIFRVFERLDGGSDAPPGTGIGLAVVRRGMERLGGRAGVEDRESEGSVFWIEIPRAVALPPDWAGSLPDGDREG